MTPIDPDDGHAYSFGEGDNGQLGHGTNDVEQICEPRRIHFKGLYLFIYLFIYLFTKSTPFDEFISYPLPSFLVYLRENKSELIR